MPASLQHLYLSQYETRLLTTHRQLSKTSKGRVQPLDKLVHYAS